MILWGTRTKAVVVAVLMLVCDSCGQQAHHQLIKRQTKFTLFFVPLFPIRTKHLALCGACGVDRKLSKEQAEHLHRETHTAA